MKKLNSKNIEKRLEAFIREYAPKKHRMSVKKVKEYIYRDDDLGGMESIKDYQEWFLGIFQDTNADIDEVVSLCMDSWNAFPHKTLGGKSPQEIAQEYGYEKELSPKRKKLSGKSQVMSSVIRKSMDWLGENFDTYKEDHEGAWHLFFDPRENGDIPDIDVKDSKHEAFFNEWLLLDFSVFGYDDIPLRDRKSFLDLFLEEKRGSLSQSEVFFAENLSRSIFSLYQVLEVESGAWMILQDTLREDVLYKVYESNTSTLAEKGFYVTARVVEEKPGRHILGGSMSIPLHKELHRYIHFLISGGQKLSQKEFPDMNMEAFLKWNSYMYYREIDNWLRNSGQKED